MIKVAEDNSLINFINIDSRYNTNAHCIVYGKYSTSVEIFYLNFTNFKKEHPNFIYYRDKHLICSTAVELMDFSKNFSRINPLFYF